MQPNEPTTEKQPLVRLDRELANIVDEIAKQERRSRAFMVRDLIREALLQRGINA